MKRYIVCMLSTLLTLQYFESFSQNLIPNPGFELYTQCISNLGLVNNCLDWITVEKTPDYFNSCVTTNINSVPINYFGYQPAHSGCAYCGFYSLCTCPTQWKEYFQAKLKSTLVIGIKYYFSFNLALVDGGNGIGNWTSGSNKMGFRLSTMPYLIGDNGSPATDNYATFYTDSIITDTINWTTIRGSIIADSTYSYITFGNFFDSAHVQSIFIVGGDTVSYYYIDDVCLSTDSLTCESVSDTCRSSPVNSISDNWNEENQIVFPNPFSDLLTVEIPGHEECEIRINDIFGREILKQQFNERISLNTKKFTPGVYVYEVRSKKGIVNNGKVLKGQY